LSPGSRTPGGLSVSISAVTGDGQAP